MVSVPGGGLSESVMAIVTGPFGAVDSTGRRGTAPQAVRGVRRHSRGFRVVESAELATGHRDRVR